MVRTKRSDPWTGIFGTNKSVGNALGGGVDIGSPYLGRRHSSIELKSGSKPFQYTVEEYQKRVEKLVQAERIVVLDIGPIRSCG